MDSADSKDLQAFALCLYLDLRTITRQNKPDLGFGTP
jgi:hypothetical protein